MKRFAKNGCLDKKERISKLNDTDLKNFVNKAVLALLKSVSKYTTDKNLALFKKGKVTLLDIGICNGVTLLIDEDLKKVNKHLCILAHDTLVKFRLDITKEF